VDGARADKVLVEGERDGMLDCEGEDDRVGGRERVKRHSFSHSPSIKTSRIERPLKDAFSYPWVNIN
jgi:hypothetical protein